MKRFTNRCVFSLIAVLVLWAAQQRCVAGSATWAAQPISSDWSTAQNWTPETVPNAPTDTATFGVSAITEVALSVSINVGSLRFANQADAFRITAEPATVLFFNGQGIQNASDVVQNFVCLRNGGFGGGFFFLGNATAGENTSFTVAGNLVSFHDSSSAGHGTFVVTNDPGVSQGSVLFFNDSSAAEGTFIVPTAGIVDFLDTANAANAVFTATGGMYGPGSVDFGTNATAGNAVINCSAGGEIAFTELATADHARVTVAGAASTTESQSHIDFIGSSTAANSRITLNGGSAVGTAGAIMNLFDESTAGAAQITLNGGTNGGNGASVVFYSKSNGGTATFKVFDNGQIDISKNTLPTIGIGSLEGSGQVFLGARTLTIGSNNHNTLFSGVLQDGGLSGKTGGKLTKTGTGTLTLGGASTYTGSTTVTGGTLNVVNKTGSATGNGAVTVSSGTLGGKGIIAGATMIGTGSGAGAFLAPAVGTKKQATLTIQSALTCNSDATYTCTFKAKANKARTDEVIANGVTLNGAVLNLTGQAQGRLRRGLTLTLISNMSASAIDGTFNNLPDGAVISVGGNNLQASYEGGDGNDLTLTVVP